MGREDCRPEGQEGDDHAVEDHPGQEQPDVVPPDGDDHQQVGQQHEGDGKQDDLDDPRVDGGRLRLLLILLLRTKIVTGLTS